MNVYAPPSAHFSFLLPSTTTACDAARDPTEWAVWWRRSDAAAGDPWTEIDRQRGVVFAARHEARTFAVAPPPDAWARLGGVYKVAFYRTIAGEENGAATIPTDLWRWCGEPTALSNTTHGGWQCARAAGACRSPIFPSTLAAAE